MKLIIQKLFELQMYWSIMPQQTSFKNPTRDWNFLKNVLVSVAELTVQNFNNGFFLSTDPT